MKLKRSILIILVMLNVSAAFAQGPMGASDIIKALEVVNSFKSLFQCKKKPFEDLGYKNVKNADGSLTPVSILTDAQLKKVYQLLALRKDIPFRYPEDGCYARALKMNMILDDLGIQSGKVFIEGELYVSTSNDPKGYVDWTWHVAPFVFVKTGDKVAKQVIDPSLFSKPVSVSQWTAIQTSNNQKECIDKVYFTTPYTYFPVTKGIPEPEEYDPEQIKHSDETLKEYLKRQK